MAKNNYEALNSQLLEELPRLTAKCMTFIKCCLSNFVKARRFFLSEFTEEIRLMLQVCSYSLTSQHLSYFIINITSSSFYFCLTLLLITFLLFVSNSEVFMISRRITLFLLYLIGIGLTGLSNPYIFNAIFPYLTTKTNNYLRFCIKSSNLAASCNPNLLPILAPPY